MITREKMIEVYETAKAKAEESRGGVLCVETWREESGIYIVKHDNKGKLAGMNSLSTSPQACDNCLRMNAAGQPALEKRKELIEEFKRGYNKIKRQEKNKAEGKKVNHKLIKEGEEIMAGVFNEIVATSYPVCAVCFSHKDVKQYKGLRACLEKNAEILTSKILKDEEIPILNRLYFRIEAHGDLINVTQAINYLKFIQKNPSVTFAWWTKRPQILQKALDQLGIEMPKNVVGIFSSYLINQAAPDSIAERYPWIKIIFTVYDQFYIMTHPEVEINCGNRKCLNCLKCYTRKQGLYHVNELVKN